MHAPSSSSASCGKVEAEYGAPRGQKLATRTGERSTRRSTTRQGNSSPLLPKRADTETQTEENIEQDVQVITQEHNSERIMEQTVDAPFPQAMEGIVEFDNAAPTPAVARKRRTGKSVASAPAVACATPTTVKECVASSPVACAAPAPVIEYVASSPSEDVAPTPDFSCAAPAPEIEYVASAPLPFQRLHRPSPTVVCSFWTLFTPRGVPALTRIPFPTMSVRSSSSGFSPVESRPQAVIASTALTVEFAFVLVFSDFPTRERRTFLVVRRLECDDLACLAPQSASCKVESQSSDRSAESLTATVPLSLLSPR